MTDMHLPPPSRPRRDPPAPSFGSRVSDIALTVLSVLGGVCIILVIIALVFKMSLIMFATGSMAPSIPSGSLALVQQIPASEAHIGDVVTVDRGEELPITHRVVAVEASSDPTHRLLTLRGDANGFNDSSPYDVEYVRRVLFSVPHLARAVVWMSHPAVMASITVSMALLVTWAFWPRPERRRRPKVDDAQVRERRGKSSPLD